jgi:hypothetical protein
LLHPSLLLPLDGCGGEGRISREVRQEAELRRQWYAKKLKLRQIPSVNVHRRRYPWSRGPPRTADEAAPRRFYFLQTFVPLRRIFDLGMATHPDDEPSGVVPGVTASDCGSRSSQRRGGEGLGCFPFYLSRVLLVILQDFCASFVLARVLFVIVPAD